MKTLERRVARLEAFLGESAMPEPAVVGIWALDGSYDIPGGYADPEAFEAANPDTLLVMMQVVDGRRPENINSGV